MNYENKKIIFDERLKELAIQNKIYSENDFLYITRDNNTYPNYLNNNLFEKLLNIMKENNNEIYMQYKNGSGGELDSKYSRKTKKYIPPKMASIASSSRFAYLTFIDKNNYNEISKIINEKELENRFYFEEKLNVKNIKGATPNLDVMAKTKDGNSGIFFEVKCHELFNHHIIEFSDAYIKTNVLTSKKEYSLQFNENELKMNKDKVRINKSVFGYSQDERVLIDIKQLVCHLLGIANTSYEKKQLIYLYFKPKNINDKEINDIFNQLTNQFIRISKLKEILNFCNRYNISLKLVYATNDAFELPLESEITVLI